MNRETSVSDLKSTILLSEERLKNGIWPRSISLWMMAFYIALFIIRPWEQLFPSLATIRFEKLYAICMIVVVLLSRKNTLRVNFQSLAVILLFFAISISAFFAENSYLAWERVYEYLTLTIFYFILILVIRTPYQLVFVVTCYIFTMAVYLAKSQWEFFVYGAHRYDVGSGIIRMCGIESTFGGPNSLAMSIIASLPMLLFLWSIREGFSCEWPGLWRKWFPRFLVSYSLLAISSIILTNSRSGMVSFVLFVALVALFRGKGIGRKFGFVLLALLILAIIWLMMPEENRKRFRSTWDPSAGTAVARRDAEGRIEGLKAGIEMFNSSPVTGVGIGNFAYYRNKYLDGVPFEAHNLIGQLLGETGILGGGAFLLLVSVALMNCHKIRALAKRNPSDDKLKILSGLALACRDCIILLAFEGMFGHNLTRFNWLWLVAFSSLALQFAKTNMKRKILRNDYSQVVP